MSKAKASMVKTIDLIELDSKVTVTYQKGSELHTDSGEVHAIDAIGIAIYHPLLGTVFLPWTSVVKVVVS
jgi:hypothetical protein